MSHNVSKDMVWHGMECMYLYGLSSCWSLQSSLVQESCFRWTERRFIWLCPSGQNSSDDMGRYICWWCEWWVQLALHFPPSLTFHRGNTFGYGLDVWGRACHFKGGHHAYRHSMSCGWNQKDGEPNKSKYPIPRLRFQWGFLIYHSM